MSRPSNRLRRKRLKGATGTNAPHIKWLETLTPKNGSVAPPAAPLWIEAIVLGPVVEFRMIEAGGQIMWAQAYPVGTGNTVSNKVEWFLDHCAGSFQFGVQGKGTGKRLLVRLTSAADISAFHSAFPEVAR